MIYFNSCPVLCLDTPIYIVVNSIKDEKNRAERACEYIN